MNKNIDKKQLVENRGVHVIKMKKTPAQKTALINKAEKRLTRSDAVKLFTFAEGMVIFAAMPTNANVRNFHAVFSMMDSLSLTDLAVIEAVKTLEKDNLIAKGRAAEILQLPVKKKPAAKPE